MSEYELIDIVDENDNFVRTIERTPEWNKTRPDTFRGIGVFVKSSDGKIVIQQRSHRKNSSALMFDSSVGGIVTSGLSYEETAKKEMSEELGISGELRFIGAFKRINDNGIGVRSHIHLFETVSDGPFTNWEEEAERLEFMTIDELKMLTARFPYLFTGGFRKAFEVYLQYCETNKIELEK